MAIGLLEISFWDTQDMTYDSMVMMHCYVGTLSHSPTRVLRSTRRFGVGEMDTENVFWTNI